MTEEYIKETNRIRLSGREFNVYCDESCHLEHDGFKSMSLGAIWCPKDKVREINKRLIEIKEENGISKSAEVKWTKISPCNEKLYKDLIDYFFDDDDLHFRGLIVPDKSRLNHNSYSQTHNQWYYKMYFDMLKAIFKNDAEYFVYIDIKDTHSGQNAQKLENVCANDKYDFSHEIIRRVQPIRSDEVQLMQLVDIFVGACAFRHNYDEITPETSRTKIRLINRIIRRSGVNLLKTTLMSEEKINLLVWQADWGR